MADLIPRPSGRGGERGQLLLIAAFIVAVSFVALALVVNSAIFTENLATRDDVAGSKDALEHRHEVEQSVEEAVVTINQNNSIDSSEIEDNVEAMGNQGGLQQASQGRVLSVEHISNTDGIKIAQDNPDDFTNVSDYDKTWTVVEGVTSTRNMRINMTEGPSALDSTSPFQITVQGSEEWSLTIEPGTVNDVKIVVEYGPTGFTTQSETCTSDFEDYLIIDITEGTIGGEPCHALTRKTDGTPMWFANNIFPGYEVQFENPTNIEGKYSFIVNDGSLYDTSELGTDSGDTPYREEDSLYGVRVLYGYYTADVGYQSEIRIAPGELPP